MQTNNQSINTNNTNNTNNSEDTMSYNTESNTITIIIDANTTKNSLQSEIMSTIQTARKESSLSRGYSALFFMGTHHADANDTSAETIAVDSIKNGGGCYNICLAPSRKKQAIKFSMIIRIVVASDEKEETKEDAVLTSEKAESTSNTTETKKAQEKAKEDTKAAQAKAIDLGIGEIPFGAFVWWNMRNIRVTPKNGRKIVQDALRGVYPQDMIDMYSARIKDIDANHTILTEGKKWKFHSDDDKYTCGIADQDDSTITFGIKQNTVHNVNGKMRNDDLQVETVVWDFASSEFIAGGGTDASDRFIADMLDLCTFHKTKGIRPLVQTMVEDLNAISLKDQGGFYLVAMDAANPDQTLDRLATIRAFVASFGNSQMMVATQNSDSARQACEEDVLENLENEIASLEEKVDRWNANTKKTASDALGRAVNDFASVKSKARLFAAALQMQASDLIDRIEKMEDDVVALQTKGTDSKNGRTVTDTMLDTVHDLLANGDTVEDENGDVVAVFVDVDDIKDAKGIHESAYDLSKAVNHWKRLTSGGKAARNFGFRGVDIIAFCQNDEPVSVDSDDALSFFIKFVPFGTANDKVRFTVDAE